MRFPHCVAIFHNLPWLSTTRVIYKKSQRSAVNACGNRMCKRGLRHELSLLLHFASHLTTLFHNVAVKLEMALVDHFWQNILVVEILLKDTETSQIAYMYMYFSSIKLSMWHDIMKWWIWGGSYCGGDFGITVFSYFRIRKKQVQLKSTNLKCGSAP